MSTLRVTKIADGLWQFNEKGDQDVDAYLLVGSERALLIDALMNCQGVYKAIWEITALPVDALVEHGHLDHCGYAAVEIKDAGGRVYLHPADREIIKGRTVVSFPPDFFTDIQEGARLDLGGIVLDILAMPGHTPGSLMALDRERQWLFSSDSIGSGPFWVQIPGSLPLGKVRDNLARVQGELAPYRDLLIYPGHRSQSPGQLGPGYIADVLETINLVLEGKLTGSPVNFGPFFPDAKDWLNVQHKSCLGLCYNPNNF